jgi:hypothetical protein
MIIPRTFLFLTAALLLSVPLMAQERSLRAVFFQRPPDMPKTAVLYHPATNVEVNLPPMNLSEPVSIPAGDQVFAILPQALQPGDPIPPGAPQIKVPGAWQRVILLFFPDQSNKVFPVRALPVDGSLDKFKPGDLFCYNLSTAEVAGTLGEAKFRIAEGQSAIIKPSRTESGDYPVAIDCLLPGETRSSPLCRTTWRHDTEIRQLLFIVNAKDRPTPRIWAIPETVTQQ